MSVNTNKALPKGWKWEKLEELCLTNTGTRNPQDLPDNFFCYVDISSVDNVKKEITGYQKIYGKDAPSRARKVIRYGDIIVATTRPNLNSVALVPIELDNQICSTGFCVLRPTEKIDADFLFCFVQTNWFVDSLVEMVQGAMYPAVSDAQVLAQYIPLPLIDEQRRIATILREQMAAVAHARAAAEAQLEVAKKLFSQYLNLTFTDKDAKLWKRIRIQDFAQTTSGMTPLRSRDDYFNGKIPWIKTGELKDNFISKAEEYITETALRETSLSILPENTLLVAMYGQGTTRGRTGILTIPATTNQACFAILPNTELFDTRFLQFWFMHNYQRLRVETDSRGGSQPNLNGVVLKKQFVQFPDLAIQRRIADHLSHLMSETTRLINSSQAQLASINALPSALLRRAFAGEL
jgi:type I restriction enzyme S subunit